MTTYLAIKISINKGLHISCVTFNVIYNQKV